MIYDMKGNEGIDKYMEAVEACGLGPRVKCCDGVRIQFREIRSHPNSRGSGCTIRIAPIVGEQPRRLYIWIDSTTIPAGNAETAARALKQIFTALDSCIREARREEMLESVCGQYEAAMKEKIIENEVK